MKLKASITKRQAIQNARTVILAAVVASAVVVSFSIIGVKFLWDLRGFQQRVIARKETARDQLNDNLENAKQLESSFNEFEKGNVNAQEVLDALPSKYDFPALATSIEALALRTGLILDSFSGDDMGSAAEATSSDPQPLEIPFTMSVLGSYENIKAFLDTLDRSIRPMQLRTIELSGADENMKADISMVTFYQPKVSIEYKTETIQ